VTESGDQPPLSQRLTTIPYAVTLGMELLSASPEEVVGRLAWREGLTTTGGAMPGGALMSLADNLGGVCRHDPRGVEVEVLVLDDLAPPRAHHEA